MLPQTNAECLRTPAAQEHKTEDGEAGQRGIGRGLGDGGGRLHAHAQTGRATPDL
jgi:hypothetical protein